jgi:hypothetical protein
MAPVSQENFTPQNCSAVTETLLRDRSSPE